MEKIKFDFDRKPLTEEAILKRQNFDQVLNSVQTTSKSTWSKYYYFGAVGLASIVATVGIFKLFQVNHSVADDNTATLNSSEITLLASDISADENNVQLAFNHSIDNDYLSSPHIHYVEEVKMSKPEDVKPVTKTVEVKVTEPVSVIEIAQTPVEPTVSTPVAKIPSVPVVAGVSQGNINWADFKSNAIIVDENHFVKQFSIQYTSRSGNRSVTINGDKITPEVIKELEQVNMNQTIFITNIISTSAANETKRLLSMELNVIFK